MRVLLVEDDPSTQQSVTLMLETAGMVVDATDLGEDGLDLGKLYDYDIIVLDLMLPDMDGMDVLRRLRDARVKTPVLIFPASRSRKTRSRDWARAPMTI